MQFTPLFSSSKGNAYVVTANNGKRLLVECGVSWPLLQKALGYDLTGIEGCLLSHEHEDHSKAIHDAMKAGIDVYASKGTLEACGVSMERRAIPVYAKKRMVSELLTEDFSVLCFDSYHDAMEPYLYAINCDHEWLLFCTDTSHIRQKFSMAFDIIAIECSYNEPYLRKREEEGTINTELAKRLLESHMSESNCLSYLQNFCNLDKCREIHLLHMSADNLNKDRIKREFEKKLFIEIKVI